MPKAKLHVTTFDNKRGKLLRGQIIEVDQETMKRWNARGIAEAVAEETSAKSEISKPEIIEEPAILPAESETTEIKTPIDRSVKPNYWEMSRNELNLIAESRGLRITKAMKLGTIVKMLEEVDGTL